MSDYTSLERRVSITARGGTSPYRGHVLEFTTMNTQRQPTTEQHTPEAEPARHVRRGVGRGHVMYLIGLVLLALGMWWPLPLRLGTHVPGTPTWAFDESTFLWNTWYFQHALLRLQTNPLYTDLIWHPLGIALILYTYNFFNALVAQPVYWATGNLPLASNLTLIAHTVLSGYGTFLLVRYLTRHRGAPYTTLGAGVAGLVFAFASNRSVYAALGHYNMVSTAALPFFTLYLVKTLDTLGTRRAYRHAAMAGLFFAMAALAESILAVFLAIFTLILVLTYWLPNIARARVCPISLARTLLPLGVLGGVAAILWAPVLVPLVREQLTGNYVLKGWGDSLKLSVDLLGFITPTALHPLWGTDWTQALRAVEEGTARFADVNTVFLGYATLALAAVGVWAARGRARPWVWTAVIFALFALGPVLQINGRWQFDMDGIPVSVPMPFALLHYLPFVKGNRAPNRNGVMVMLALAVLAGYGVAWLSAHARRFRPRGAHVVATLAAALILFEHAALPLPLSDARVPSVYDRIAAEPGEFAVLQVPLGWRNSFGVFGVERTQLQYYQTKHGKPMVGGNISRAPDFKMDYFRRIPLFQALAEVEFGAEPDPDLVARARAQAPELMRLYNVRYVLLFPPIPGRHPYAETWQRSWDFAREVLPLEPTPFWEGDGIVAYRVVQPSAPVATAVDLGEPGTEPYRGEGWYENEIIQGRSAVWAGATGTEARVFLRADGDGPHTLSLTALAFTYPGAPPQTLQVLLNGHALAPPRVLAPEWEEIVLEVPPGITRDHTNEITLRFAWTARPRDVFEGRRAIGQTGVNVPVDVELTAFAEGAYMTTVDDKGTRRDVSFGRRGYNITVLDPKTGRVLQKAGFDTYANIYEAQRMAEFIARIPDGAIVLVATRGDAGRHLTDEAVNALRSLGSAVDLRQHPGAFHALVGVKGARPGTAEEVVDAQSAYIRLGDYPDFRHLGIAVDTITLQPSTP